MAFVWGFAAGQRMAESRFWRGVAGVVRRAPWLMLIARQVWRWRQAKFSAGVVGVVLNEAGEILLVEHVFHPYTPWGLPGGWVERGEDPAQTVQRELCEELQLAVEVGPVLLVKPDPHQHLDIAYLCYPLNEVGRLSSELLGYQWLRPEQLPRLHAFHDLAVQQALKLTIQA